MSHYFAIVIIPPEGDVNEHVERLMAPHREEWVPDGGVDEYGDETGQRVGFWDWYQVGGRWTGVLTEYRPSEDPRNQETCFLCRGSGRRTDIPPDDMGAYIAGPMKGCNGCLGEGVKAKWPTSWVPYPGDVMPVAEYAALFHAIEKCRPYHFLTEGVSLMKESWNGENFIEHEDYIGSVKAILRNLPDDARAVVVDYHS